MSNDKKNNARTAPKGHPSLRSLMSDEEFASYSPAAQKRILEGKSMEGWSESGDDSWLHGDEATQPK